MFFAAVCGLWFLAGLADNDGLIEILAVPAVLGGLGTAGYTAYLFAQCEGRDLWQTPLLLPVLLAQAVTAGGATYAVLDLFMAVPETEAIAWVLLGGVGATAALVWMELASHGSRHVELAVETMTHGRYARQFWIGGVGSAWSCPQRSRSSLSPPTPSNLPCSFPPLSPPSSACSPTKTPSSGPASPSRSPDRLLAES